MRFECYVTLFMWKKKNTSLRAFSLFSLKDLATVVVERELKKNSKEKKKKVLSRESHPTVYAFHRDVMQTRLLSQAGVHGHPATRTRMKRRSDTHTHKVMFWTIIQTVRAQRIIGILFRFSSTIPGQNLLFDRVINFLFLRPMHRKKSSWVEYNFL